MKSSTQKANTRSEKWEKHKLRHIANKCDSLQVYFVDVGAGASGRIKHKTNSKLFAQKRERLRKEGERRWFFTSFLPSLTCSNGSIWRLSDAAPPSFSTLGSLEKEKKLSTMTLKGWARRKQHFGPGFWRLYCFRFMPMRIRQKVRLNRPRLRLGGKPEKSDGRASESYDNLWLTQKVDAGDRVEHFCPGWTLKLLSKELESRVQAPLRLEDPRWGSFITFEYFRRWNAFRAAGCAVRATRKLFLASS